MGKSSVFGMREITPGPGAYDVDASGALIKRSFNITLGDMAVA